MRIKKGFRNLLTAASMAAGSFASAQIVLNRVDDFQSGTTMSWVGGTDPVNIANGGPMGVGDRYLSVTGTGSSGAGGVPATYNGDRWFGNWNLAGVKVIRVQVKNFGTPAISLRAVLHDLMGTRWTTTNSYTVNGGAGWLSFYMPVRESAWTRVLGSASFTAMTNNVGRLMFRHDSGSPSSGGTPLATTMGLDNITPLPYIRVNPSAVSVSLGSILGGGVNELAASDNTYLIIVNDEFDSNTVATFDGTSPATSIFSMTAKFEASATRNDLGQYFELKNYSNNQFDQADFRLSTLTDSTVTVTYTTNPGRYVDSSTGAIQCRVRYIPTGDIDAADGWSERIDHVEYQIVP